MKNYQTLVKKASLTIFVGGKEKDFGEGVIVMDYPEHKKHPSEQIKIAHEIVYAINSGAIIVLNTFSDYILIELSTLIILHRSFPDCADLMVRYGYNSMLPECKVAVYEFTNDQYVFVPISNAGIEIQSISLTITKLVEISDRVYYSYLDSLPEE